MSGQGPGRQGAGASRGSGQQPAPVSPLMIPLLVLGLAIGFLSGYFLLWWGALVVLGVIVAAVSLVLRGRSRDGATGAIAGVLLGYAGVILVALFRGAL
ncbi:MULTISPECIES: hypothetical protein [Brachybacterium]|nr:MULTISPECIES: hypothetical protein [Brachybacterium]MCT1438522.1 hypothetical protein [Brachybacterium paraconglomeratum]GLI31623.1 hypothetical protein BCONGLO52_24640 [Brachybacterium conglomeratum]GLK06335.1 hypothetical protein GCM10017597_31350 [Brachybacterium conglomeratum]